MPGLACHVLLWIQHLEKNHLRVTLVMVLFKTACNCFCIELYSWMCIHQRMKSNVTFSSFTKSTSIRCHSTQKWGNQEKAELVFIMCWKRSEALKCQSKKKKEKKNRWRESELLWKWLLMNIKGKHNSQHFLEGNKIWKDVLKVRVASLFSKRMHSVLTFPFLCKEKRNLHTPNVF